MTIITQGIWCRPRSERPRDDVPEREVADGVDCSRSERSDTRENVAVSAAHICPDSVGEEGLVTLCPPVYLPARAIGARCRSLSASRRGATGASYRSLSSGRRGTSLPGIEGLVRFKSVLRYAAVPFDTPLLVPHSGTQEDAYLTAATQETGLGRSFGAAQEMGSGVPVPMGKVQATRLRLSGLQDHVCVCAGVLGGEQLLLLYRPAFPVRAEGFAVAFDAASHADGSVRLHPGEGGDVGTARP